METDIFISYSKKDSEIIATIEKELKKYDVTYFYDQPDIYNGEEHRNMIANALSECKVVLFIWSENSINSVRIEKEVIDALELNKIIVPFKVGGDSISISGFDLHLVAINSIIIEVCNECEVVKLCKELARIFEKSLILNINKEPWIDEYNVKFNTNKENIIRAPESLIIYTIPTGTVVICKGVFSYCSDLSHIVIPDSVKLIGEEAFDNCMSLNQITIPDSVIKIGERAFSSCKNLSSITISNSIKQIETSTFWGCESLKQLVIPNSVEHIGYKAFCGCSKLSQITISNSVTIIDNYAFSKCTSLTQITLPDSLREIRGGAFDKCTNLTQITLTSLVAYIGEGAFDYCENLTQIIIPKGSYDHFAKATHSLNEKLVGIKDYLSKLKEV